MPLILLISHVCRAGIITACTLSAALHGSRPSDVAAAAAAAANAAEYQSAD